MSTRYTIQIVIVEVNGAGEVISDAVETFGPTLASDDLDALVNLAVRLHNDSNESFRDVVGAAHTSSLWESDRLIERRLH